MKIDDDLIAKATDALNRRVSIGNGHILTGTKGAGWFIDEVAAVLSALLDDGIVMLPPEDGPVLPPKQDVGEWGSVNHLEDPAAGWLTPDELTDEPWTAMIKAGFTLPKTSFKWLEDAGWQVLMKPPPKPKPLLSMTRELSDLLREYHRNFVGFSSDYATRMYDCIGRAIKEADGS